MTEYRKIDLYRAIKDTGSVTLTVVPHNGNDSYDLVFKNYEWALQEIKDLNYENDTYF